MNENARVKKSSEKPIATQADSVILPVSSARQLRAEIEELKTVTREVTSRLHRLSEALRTLTEN